MKMVRDHLGRDETPAPQPGILHMDHYDLPYGYSTFRLRGTKDWLIMYTISGQGIVLDGDHPLFSRSGDMILIPPNTPHLYYTAPGTNWEKMWCHFLPRPAWTDWLALPIPSNPITQLSIEQDESKQRIETAFKRLQHYSHSHYQVSTYREELALNALEEILLLTIGQTANPRSIDSRIREVQVYLQQHYAKECQIEHLAKLVCLSPSRLAHLFKEQVGETIIDWLIKLRMKHAERLIRFSPRNITEIAYEVGFHSPDYFTRKFKQFYSVSPTQFRKQL
ncbi:arabinose operon transcriptional regulator AraC [Paenibacillus taihuensis]|nr:arabinose operon transcriptional regulator AraC [Paenibacillus taihuensis]